MHVESSVCLRVCAVFVLGVSEVWYPMILNMGYIHELLLLAGRHRYNKLDVVAPVCESLSALLDPCGKCWVRM